MAFASASSSSDTQRSTGVRLVFLGRLADLAGTGEMTVTLADSIEGLLNGLDPALARILREQRVKLAINGVLLRDLDAPLLKEGDEIAFLPPVSGG